MSNIVLARRQFRAAADRTPAPTPPVGYRNSAANFDRLVRRGLVVWAAVIRVNNSISTHGGGDVFAKVAWSEEPVYDTKPEELLKIAQAAFALPNTAPTADELIALAEAVRQKSNAVTRLKIPPQLTGGKKVWMTTVFVNRSCLPGGVLISSMVPLLIDPLEHANSVVLPSEYWPPELVAKWQGASATAPRAEDVAGVKEVQQARQQFLTQVRQAAERGQYLQVTPAAAAEVRRMGAAAVLQVRYATHKGEFRHECEPLGGPSPCALATESEGVRVQVPDEHSVIHTRGVTIDFVRKGAEGEFTVQAPVALSEVTSSA